ncbi:MAG: phage major capsid protein, partial [Clostridiales Family XIII bacterium]|nr:phage major capsid protein [Clostridiales Family XIII bacterium]
MELIRSDFREKYAAALASADENAVADALTECSAAAQAQMVELAEEIRSDFTAATDSIVMAQRGVKTLNSAETKYWESVVSVMKDKPQSSGVAVVPEALPTTVVDRIFEDLVQEHQILNYINFQNVGLITRMLLSTDSGAAVWGDFKGVIEGELEGAVTAVSLDQYKLTAYFVIAEDMLELGPAWVANFITTVIGEKIAVGLELAIVDGDGNKKPIGMSRKLTGATDSVYPRKTAKKITDLSPATIGGLLKIISEGPKG